MELFPVDHLLTDVIVKQREGGEDGSDDGAAELWIFGYLSLSSLDFSFRSA